MRLLPATFVVLVFSHPLLAAEPAAPDARGAVQRSIAFLEKDSLGWKENRHCASCHHAPFTLWAFNEAKKQGYTVTDKAIAELTAWAVAKDNPAKVFVDRPPQKEKLVSQAPLLMALGIEAGDPKDAATREGLQKMLSVLLADQRDDGSWGLGDGRLPLVASSEVMTTLTLLALTSPASPDLGKEAKAAREKALKWLETAPPGEDLQALALRTILRQRLGRPREDLQPLGKQLLSRQNADGGWSQAKEMESDAFATGQALYALAAAGVGGEDAAVKKAQAFLVKAQKEDGSWPMTSRPMKPGAKGSTNLAPITHAGTAWGTLGLIRSTTKEPSKGK